MTRKSRPLSNLSKALLEMAEDMHNAGLMGGDTYRTINARLLDDHAGGEVPEGWTPDRLPRNRP